MAKYEMRPAGPDEQMCIGSTRRGDACRLLVAPGSKYCPCHGGNKAAEAFRKKTVYDFKLNQYLNEQGSKASNFSEMKTLKGELVINRLLQQEILGMIKQEGDAFLYSDKLMNLSDRTQKLVEATLKIEKMMGELLSKEQLIVIAGQLAEAIYEIVSDPDEIEKLNKKFSEILESHE